LPWTRMATRTSPDSTSSTVSVVYRGGHSVANFIKLVNRAAVANSPKRQVTVGYVTTSGRDHLGSPLNTGATCAGSKSNKAIHRNAPAFENTAIPGRHRGRPLSVPPRLRWTAREISISRCWKHNGAGVKPQAPPDLLQYTVQAWVHQSDHQLRAVMTAPHPAPH